MKLVVTCTWPPPTLEVSEVLKRKKGKVVLYVIRVVIKRSLLGI
jgi:hypothetical protein